MGRSCSLVHCIPLPCLRIRLRAGVCSHPRRACVRVHVLIRPVNPAPHLSFSINIRPHWFTSCAYACAQEPAVAQLARHISDRWHSTAASHLGVLCTPRRPPTPPPQPPTSPLIKPPTLILPTQDQPPLEAAAAAAAVPLEGKSAELRGAKSEVLKLLEADGAAVQKLHAASQAAEGRVEGMKDDFEMLDAEGALLCIVPCVGCVWACLHTWKYATKSPVPAVHVHMR